MVSCSRHKAGAPSPFSLKHPGLSRDRRGALCRRVRLSEEMRRKAVGGIVLQALPSRPTYRGHSGIDEGNQASFPGKMGHGPRS